MILSKLLVRLARQIRYWDRPSQIALTLALVLLVVMVIAAIAAPDLRQPALFGAVGLIVVIQAIVLWGNRGMVTPFTEAQRHYMNEDFAAARDVLEALRLTGKADVRALTLLGNTYRQLGQLDYSESVLYEAINIQADHFPLYGFGRTLLAQGRYAEAAQAIERALTLGAPDVVKFDLAEALIRAGDVASLTAARELVNGIQPSEPYRALMVAFWQYRYEGEVRPSPELLQQGLPYWQASAERFQHTPYGRAVAQDVAAMTEEQS